MYGAISKPTCAMYLFHEKKITYEHGNASIPALESRHVSQWDDRLERSTRSIVSTV